MVGHERVDSRVAAVRAFNRFYTRKIGVLQNRMLSTPFSFAEARVLYELAHRERPTATDIRKELGLDAGYVSRILREFERKKLVTRTPSKSDERQRFLSLTAKGRRAYAPLEERSDRDVAAMLEGLAPAERNQVVEAMRTIERLLGGNQQAKTPYLLRQHRPGDMGWIVHRHAVLYAQEYGWDERCEALFAEIAAKFITQYDPKRDRCWIAEKDGATAGSVFLVKETDEVARLRLLLLEPWARGLGLGKRLVDECIRFARQAGYRKITLWTQSILYAARHIYQQAGFQLVREEKHHSFGHDLVGETWELDLQPPAAAGLQTKGESSAAR